MNIKTKLTFGIGTLVLMIVLIIILSVVNLQIITDIAPSTTHAADALHTAILWIVSVGALCIIVGIILLFHLPSSIVNPMRKLVDGIQEIANHNYSKRLELKGTDEFIKVSNNFNRMSARLQEYHVSTLAEMKSGKQYLEAIINGINEPVIGMNNDFEILFINDKALSVMNLDRDNVIKVSAQKIAITNDLMRRVIRPVVDNVRPQDPIRLYADDKENYYQVEYSDITQPRKDRSGMEHKGYVVLLKNVTEYKLKESGSEIGRLELKPKITKPIELIDYALKVNNVQAEKFNIQIEVDYPEEKIGKLFVDSEKIAWVLTNLLSNAIRHSYENSRVVIGARDTGDGFIELFVTDFGKGIDPRYHESIFDHYFRVPGAKVQGSGLGLSISRDFVEAHGGTLTIDSEVGKGSTFIIKLKK